MKKFTSLLIALLVVLSLAAPVLAADASIKYTGHSVFDFAPGSPYHATDLFVNFKGVMPGDVLTQKITVSNTARCCDYIKIYLQAIPHEDQIPHGDDNPLSPEVAKEETIASMEDFLAQLKLTVMQGSTVIYSGPADKMDEMNRHYLGTLNRNKSTTLELTLEVSPLMDNRYAFREGEIDWVITIEEYDYKSSNPKSGDHMQKYMLPALLTMAVSGGLLILLVAKRRRNRK